MKISNFPGESRSLIERKEKREERSLVNRPSQFPIIANAINQTGSGGESEKWRMIDALITRPLFIIVVHDLESSRSSGVPRVRGGILERKMAGGCNSPCLGSRSR